MRRPLHVAGLGRAPGVLQNWRTPSRTPSAGSQGDYRFRGRSNSPFNASAMEMSPKCTLALDDNPIRIYAGGECTRIRCTCLPRSAVSAYICNKRMHGFDLANAASLRANFANARQRRASIAHCFAAMPIGDRRFRTRRACAFCRAPRATDRGRYRYRIRIGLDGRSNAELDSHNRACKFAR